MEDLVVGDLIIPADELEERFDTSGGPGGQHANRSNTAVTLRFDIAKSSLPEEVRARLLARLGEMVEVRASESRSQARNRQTARERMEQRIAKALRVPKRRKRTGPTRRSLEDRLAAKRARSQLKRSRRPPKDHD